TQLETRNSKPETRLAGRHVPGGERPAPRLVPVVAADLAGRKWSGALPDGVDSRIHGGRGSRENLQEQTRPGWLREAANRRCLREEMGRGHPAPLGRVPGFSQ